MEVGGGLAGERGERTRKTSKYPRHPRRSKEQQGSGAGEEQKRLAVDASRVFLPFGAFIPSTSPRMCLSLLPAQIERYYYSGATRVICAYTRRGRSTRGSFVLFLLST
ncbi:hypothetical protein HPB48_006609 [Haemaphysalis longicornis]|uniref:Uncharacterized protein n=1 Tax=Haemaphysalis longicornis TaxID=44386 RepID=A0A9J6GQL4_HAELO|nr:hypothetical protein HPB48_006609 [Haemaphysalis longicornis]